MSHKRLYIAAAIIAAVVVISFIISVPRASSPEPSGLQASEEATPAVALSHTYKKGVYTIRGTVAAPHACTSVTAETSTTGDPVSAIVVALTLTESEGLCLMVPTPLKFSVTIEAPADLPISATVNGKTAPLTP